MRIVPSLAALVALGLLMGCNNGRSTARLAKIERISGETTSTWSYDYDDEGRLKELRYDVGDDEVLVTKFTYDDSGQLVEMESYEGDNDATTYEYEYEDGLLVEKRVTAPNGYNARTDVEYDDQGRPERAERLTEIGDDTRIEKTTTVDYDDQGRVAEWIENIKSTVEIPIIGSVEGSETREYELRFDGDTGELEEIQSEITVDDNTSRDEVEYEWEDGLLVEVFNEANDRGDVDYDDSGRIAEIEYRDSDSTYTYEYEDGTSTGVVLSPIGMPYSNFFDLEGRAFPDFDFRVDTTVSGL